MSNEQDELEEEEAPPKKSKLKIIILIIVLLLLITGGGTTFWWFQMRSPVVTDTIPPQIAATTEDEMATDATATTANTGTMGTNADGTTSGTPTKPKTVVNLVNIPIVTVNLADTDNIRYLKIGMDIEVNTTSAVKALNGQIAKVRDAIIIILSGKTYNELATTAGKLLIKNEIATRLNQILGAPRVVQIYFTEFVVQ